VALWTILFILVIKINFIRSNQNRNTIDRKQFFTTESLIDFWVESIVKLIKNNQIIQCVLGFFIINVFILSLNNLKNMAINGPSFLIFLLILVWTVDTGSYIFGKFFGKNKLLPNVSPGKTIEGAVGGLICLHFIALLLYYNFNILIYNLSLVLWLAIVNLIYLLAILGDLVESLLKRIMSVKDSGSMFPGHGGMLDRIDSLLLTMPIYCYCLNAFILN
jgi:phosphatidate cytidylyltransferase